MLYRGRVCETGPAEAVFAPPYHPYTEALLSAVPSVSAREGPAGIRLEPAAPEGAASRGGCPFHARCPRKVGAICEAEAPPLASDARGHAIACHIPRPELVRLQAVVATPTRAPEPG